MKKILIVLLLIMIIISTYQINSMFALYKSEISGEYEQLLGIWHIKVNDSTEQSIILTDDYFRFPEANVEHTADGKLAPGREICFEILLDPSYKDSTGTTQYTDVTIAYQMSIASKIATNYGTIDINTLRIEESYVKNTGETLDTNNEKYKWLQEYEKNHSLEKNVYKCVFPLGLINEGWKKKILVYFEWKNLDSTSRNENDTNIGNQNDLRINIPVNIKFEQYS